MKLVCPACGSVNSLDSLVGHDGARAALAELAALSGPLAGAVLRYLALFRPQGQPGKQRASSASTAWPACWPS